MSNEATHTATATTADATTGPTGREAIASGSACGWTVGETVTHRLGTFKIIAIDGTDLGEPQLCVEDVAKRSFKDYAFLFRKPDPVAVLNSTDQDEAVLVAWLGEQDAPFGYWPTADRDDFLAAIREWVRREVSIFAFADDESDDDERVTRYMDAITIDQVEHGE